jgi:hypothetical protein
MRHARVPRGTTSRTGVHHTLRGTGLALVLTALCVAAHAHDDAYLDTIVGPNGGQLRVTGDHHLELVVDPPEGAPASTQTAMVFITDHADQATASAGFSGRASILANRERIDIALAPAEGNQLTGQGVFAHDPDMVVVVTLTLPDGSTEQARFTPYRYLDGSPRAPSTANEVDTDASAHHHH